MVPIEALDIANVKMISTCSVPDENGAPQVGGGADRGRSGHRGQLLVLGTRADDGTRVAPTANHNLRVTGTTGQYRI